jgi:hypothetical protein
LVLGTFGNNRESNFLNYLAVNLNAVLVFEVCFRSMSF